MSMLRDQAARRRLELNPITTSSLNVIQQPQPHQTPISAISATTLSAQFGYNPAQYTPLSAVRGYNPQQWAPSPSGLSDQAQVQQRFASQDSEVVTPAPPPYSPPRSQQPASGDETPVGGSPANRVSPVYPYRSSPEPSSQATFHAPPPPPNRQRQTHDRPHSVYNISTFRPSGPAPPIPHLSPEVISGYVTPPLRSPSLQPPSLRHQPLAPEPLHPEEYHVSAPPASRRAASTGGISTPSSSRSRGSSTSRWAPGMPLPPPPPGPPPAPASRSQSANRSDHMVSPPTRRPGHLTSSSHMSSSLGPIPPTPAGWVDEGITRNKSPNRGLQIDTSSVASSSVNTESNSGSSSGGLTRHHAVKGEPKSIRERRSESKSGKRIAEEPSNNPWAEAITPADSTVPPLTILGRRPTITRSTPRSGRSFSNVETPQSADDTSTHSTPVQGPAVPNSASRGSTPRPPAPTPPFSPAPTRSAFIDSSSPAIPPKALPTPPPQPKAVLGSPAHPSLQISTREASPAARNFSRPTSRQSMSDVLPTSPAEHFARAAIERHHAFSQKEAAAASDGERVRIFAEFIVTESRLRRERYATAIDAMGSEILELTRDLFRPYNPRRDSTLSRNDGWTPESSIGPGTGRSHRSSIMASTQHDVPQLQSEPTSGSCPASPAAAPDTTWWNNYKPSLSPIPSMSMSEADSRGRPSSRWWEVSNDGGSTGQPSMRLERSKRESKYMGVPKELREKLQYDGDAIAVRNDSSNAGPSNNRRSLGPDEYPPEKVGLHEEGPTSPPLSQATVRSPAPFSPPPWTPNPDHLDVSRLVTLPPPYPRHHPAVNNNHPDLTSIRTTVRSLSDFTEVEATKSRFTQNSIRNREEQETAAKKRRNSLRISIQREIESGNMSFADAAEAEANAKITEQEKTKEASKAEFQLFQDQVVTPLNDLLQDRINRSTTLFEQLRSQLVVESQHQDPNSTQEEGDEQPELLEKLTLLKWIFEAREVLHREMYDLLTDRNDRYKEMVITPYRLAGNMAKVDNATKFFAADALQRKLKNEQDILKRTEDFMDVIEKNVRDGVEALLNAFWDIAPDLSLITAKVPRNLQGFQIQIPAAEYDENPSYYEFPMQYLYSLLGHCEKSTYQFIESQTNLLCLLHEVKSGVTLANCRLMRTQRVAQGEGEEEVGRELGEVEKDEESRLTDDLKEKVRCVEDLWSTGLGTELKGVKERIVEFLVEQGGWMEDE